MHQTDSGLEQNTRNCEEYCCVLTVLGLTCRPRRSCSEGVVVRYRVGTGSAASCPDDRRLRRPPSSVKEPVYQLMLRYPSLVQPALGMRSEHLEQQRHNTLVLNAACLHKNAAERRLLAQECSLRQPTADRTGTRCCFASARWHSETRASRTLPSVSMMRRICDHASIVYHHISRAQRRRPIHIAVCCWYFAQARPELVLPS